MAIRGFGNHPDPRDPRLNANRRDNTGKPEDPPAQSQAAEAHQAPSTGTDNLGQSIKRTGELSTDQLLQYTGANIQRPAPQNRFPLSLTDATVRALQSWTTDEFKAADPFFEHAAAHVGDVVGNVTNETRDLLAATMPDLDEPRLYPGSLHSRVAEGLAEMSHGALLNDEPDTQAALAFAQTLGLGETTGAAYIAGLTGLA